MTQSEPEPQTGVARANALEPLPPHTAQEMYMESRSDELAERSLELHEKHLGQFVAWLSDREIHNMNDVTPRVVHQYRLDTQTGFAQTTLGIRLSTIRQFVRYCESLNAVKEGAAERIVLPNRDRNARTETLDAEEATTILGYLRNYHYASRTHALMAICWHCGLRTGTLHALDVSDFDAERDRLRIRHRPETGTPLKNGESAERFVVLSPEVAEVVAEYVAENRHEVTDEHGREPLFTTKNGRPVKNSLRRHIYAATRPCATGRECPHGKDPETCGAARRTNDACKCPSTVSGHPVRRGAITHHLRKDIPEKVVSDRMNVSQKVLEKHYDRRTEDEKAEQRRKFLSNL